MKRIGSITVAAVVVLGLGACKDMGAHGSANLPLDQARNEAPKPLVQQVDPNRPVKVPGTPSLLRLGQTEWTLNGTGVPLPDGEVRAVGSARGQTVYALRWDDAPYDMLLTRLPDGEYQRYRQVYGH